MSGMTLQRKRTMAFIRQNDLMTVVMTALAVSLKAGLIEALDNWWLGYSGARDLMGLLLMTEGMNQWMNAETGLDRGYIGCTKVAESIKVGQRSRNLRTIGSWQAHTAEEAAIDSWWLQLQGNSEGQQRRLEQWLLRMLGC